MGIIYMILLISSYVLILLLKKDEKEKNLILTLSFNVLIIICYHIFITFIFYLLNIKCTLVNLSILLLFIDILFVYKIAKEKKIQKYYIKKTDIIFCFILLIFMLAFISMQYKWFNSVDYGITDGSVHYFTAMNFYEKSNLLAKNNMDFLGIYHLSSFMTGAYVNVGILFKCLSGIIDQYDFYKIYELFDVFILYISGILFYCLLTKNQKETNKHIIAYFFTIVFVLGYQINSTISGFQYLSIGLAIIIGLLIINEKDKKTDVPLCITSFLLNLGLFFSYYFFVPVVYGAILIKELKKENKNILYIIYSIILPSVFGVFYFIIRPYILRNQIPISAINTYGEIYNGNIKNFIIFIPFLIFYIFYKRKKKENSFILKMLILEILFIIALFIGYKAEIVSEYYYNKSYFLLWIIAIAITYKSIIIIIDKKNIFKNIIYFLIYIYILMFAISIYTKNDFYVFNIYVENIKEILSDEIINQSDVKLLKQIRDKKKKTDTIEYLAVENTGKALWKTFILNDYLYYINQIFVNYEVSVDEWLNQKEYNALILFKKYDELPKKYNESENNKDGISEEDYNLIKDNYNKIIESIDENNQAYEIVINNDELLMLRKNN